MRKRRPTWSRIVAMTVAVMVASAGLTGLRVAASPESATALSGADFLPGYIIADELFYDGGAMSAGEIQSFLDGKIGSCQTDRCLNVAILPVTSRPASYSVDTGALVCTAIEGGTMRVSELIYRAQVACGISARVILVTLQKEQGLVTSRAPGDWALRAAMGMGCPDTAPCSDAFAGLATQIMAGTRQLKVYSVGRFGRQPGVSFVQYHPNAACGGTNVDIRNDATAALYNYTPYQPNAAALANLGTTGDSCSSYGNRNFWSYYNSWFGPSIEIPCTVNPSRDILRHWSENGGAVGTFGAPVSPGIAVGPGGVTVGHYANGDVYCVPRTGPVGVLGEIRAKYTALGNAGGSLGAPIGPRSTFTAGGASGFIQEFQRGTMLTSSTTGTFPVLHGPIRTAWGSSGGSGGSLGWPIGDPESVSGGMRQAFQRGVIVAPTGRAALLVTGEIGAYWGEQDRADLLGLATSNAAPFVGGGVSGTLQYFERGLVLSSSVTGTHAVFDGGVRTVWGAQGGSGGSLGWPVADRQAQQDGFSQEFQRGTVFASASGMGGTVSGEIGSYWTSGSNATRLGYPTGPSGPWSAGGVSGTLQYFERGMVLASSTTGVHAVINGPVRDAWGARGGSGGSLGWPTGEQEVAAGEVRQRFQGGTVTVSSGVSGDIATYHSTGSNASRLGVATGPPIALTAGGVSGVYQVFQKGMVLSSSVTGTFAVLDGPIRTAWGAADGTSGPIGWPTGDQKSTPGGATQQFQHGVIAVPTGGTGFVLSGEIGTYWAAGSNASKLGFPTSSASPWSAAGTMGTLQYFQRGLVMSSTQTGTYSVAVGEVRNTWGATGGSGGVLGWPIADEQTYSGGVRQAFQNGLVFAPFGGTAAVLTGAIAAYWNSGSNASTLGSPTSSAAAWNAGGVAGTLQNFQRGSVLASPTTGTYSVLNGPLRDVWGGQGGSGGAFGWPVGDQQPIDGGGVRQAFQRGVLGVSNTGSPIVMGGVYHDYWSAPGNAERLGSPTASPVNWTAGGIAGSYLVFERGLVMSSAQTGTFAVLDGRMRAEWGARDGSGGPLGWPVADEKTVPEGVSQQFQHGTIVIPVSGPAYVVAG